MSVCLHFIYMNFTSLPRNEISVSVKRSISDKTPVIPRDLLVFIDSPKLNLRLISHQQINETAEQQRDSHQASSTRLVIFQSCWSVMEIK